MSYLGMDLRHSVFHQLHLAEQAAARRLRHGASRIELTRAQYEFLEAVNENGPCSQDAVVSVTGIDRSTATGVARRLKKMGFISRRRKRSDTRCYEIKLSAAGVAVLKARRSFYEKIDGPIIAALPATRRSAFVHALRLIVQAPDGVPPADAGAAKNRKFD